MPKNNPQGYAKKANKPAKKPAQGMAAKKPAAGMSGKKRMK